MIHLFVSAVYVLTVVASLACVALLRQPLQDLSKAVSATPTSHGAGARLGGYDGMAALFVLLLVALCACTASACQVG